MNLYIIQGILWFLCFMFVDSLILRGELVSNKDWNLIGKFCFISKQSSFSYKVSYAKNLQVQALLFYYDDQWNNLRRKERINKLSCEQKRKELTFSQQFELRVNNSGVGCSEEDIDGTRSISCNSKFGFSSIRPRYWFIVISKCGSNNIRLKYDLEFTNGEGPFRKHFSADEFGILETSIAFFLTYIIISIVCGVFAKILVMKSFFHITVGLYIASVVLQLISILFTMAEYGQYSQSGLVTPGMLTTSRLFQALGQIIFLLMLILVAKGYTITRNKLRVITWIKIGIFFAIYIIAYILAFIFVEALYDPGQVSYYYNSPAGITLIVIKLVLGWIWFGYSISFTIKNFPEKRIFYIILLVTFSIWFIIGPLLILVCNYFIQDYMRQFVGYLIEIIVVFIGHFIFLILIRPTAENKLFPFHVKTTQICSNSNGSYPHHNENDGGNKQLGDAKENISNLFKLKDNSSKYEFDEEKIEDPPEENQNQN